MYQNTFEDAAAGGYNNLKPLGYYMGDYHMLQDTRAEVLNADVRRLLKKSGVKVENSKGEYGFGQHELNVKYNEVLAMADDHTVYKQCFKEVADQKKMSVTFMAKPHADQSGSSCHIHMSLWDTKKGTNAFDGPHELTGVHCSDTFRHFLGGWLKHTPELMPFFAPTINSYKRYQSASWAPTRLAWSPDNRTAGFRVVGHGKSLRIECRLPGADANPYLAFAASLAAGLNGIENKIEPPAAVLGDVYSDQRVAHVPKTLNEAVHLFEHSELAKKAFGQDVVDHYVHYFREEIRSYNMAVTDWERKRYFEQI
jgi:glutamine synthetase